MRKVFHFDYIWKWVSPFELTSKIAFNQKEGFYSKSIIIIIVCSKLKTNLQTTQISMRIRSERWETVTCHLPALQIISSSKGARLLWHLDTSENPQNNSAITNGREKCSLQIFNRAHSLLKCQEGHIDQCSDHNTFEGTNSLYLLINLLPFLNHLCLKKK